MLAEHLDLRVVSRIVPLPQARLRAAGPPGWGGFLGPGGGGISVTQTTGGVDHVFSHLDMIVLMDSDMDERGSKASVGHVRRA